MSITSTADSASSSTSPRVFACAFPALIGLALLAWEFQSSGLNSPPLRWLFPGVPFLILAVLTRVKRIPLSVPIGACFGGLVPVAVLYRAMFLSMLNYNGGGADIGVGLIWLGMLFLLPFCMLIGGGVGWLIGSVNSRQRSNATHRVLTPTI